MKLLTVKDFIAYNNPCFSCGDNIHFIIVSVKSKTSWDQPVELRPTVGHEFIHFDLKTTYKKVLRVFIGNKTNSFQSTDNEDLKKYMNEHKLFLRAKCTKCNTRIESFYLDFDLARGHIKPTSISHEYLIFNDNHNFYRIETSVMRSSTKVSVSNNGNYSSSELELPLMLLSKFRNKEKLIKKLKIYLSLL